MSWIYPVPSPVRVTSPYTEDRIDPTDPSAQKHEKHLGVDFGVPVGTPIRSVFDGTVRKVGNDDFSGAHIVIRHTDGTGAGYCHLSDIQVELNQEVKQGDIIALSGGAKGAWGAGKSTGPHLHFSPLKFTGGYASFFDPADMWSGDDGMSVIDSNGAPMGSEDFGVFDLADFHDPILLALMCGAMLLVAGGIFFLVLR